ncbi:DUF2252 family protein [Cupriavidus sp. 30B13]|uniref:DUF2252 family protein n=1 Tax=Cupriavidus sp. 30B13 TaxID=3384241 RepID=UPI003B8FE87C
MRARRATSPSPEERQEKLARLRNLKMARSAHAYVRGNTLQFYDWLNDAAVRDLPQGPSVWICGDCHTGNLGPVADTRGRVEIQIRDLDQTVIGNPAHDLIRLALSLATAARGSDLPGLTTVHMLEALADGYESAFSRATKKSVASDRPASVQLILKTALRRSWKQLAKERIEDLRPTLPLGSRFWPLAPEEERELRDLFGQAEMMSLATSLRGRDDDGRVTMLDAAYWVKGCSSLGRLRYAVLLDVDGGTVTGDDLCFMDLKEAAKAAAPGYADAATPRDNAERIATGALNLSPALGGRMRAARLRGRSVVVRELLPQDLKLDVDRLAQEEARLVSRYLGTVVGRAHARQMDAAQRRGWSAELRRRRSKTIEAPLWLWSSVMELLACHEVAYLEHCRRYATAMQGGKGK